MPEPEKSPADVARGAGAGNEKNGNKGNVDEDGEVVLDGWLVDRPLLLLLEADEVPVLPAG